MLAVVSLVPPRDAGTIPHLTIRRKFQPFSEDIRSSSPWLCEILPGKYGFSNGGNGGIMHGFRPTWAFGIRGDLVLMQNRSITR